MTMTATSPSNETIRKERDRAIRAIHNISNHIPSEIFRPKNEHLTRPALIRIYNEIQKYKQAQ